MSKKKNQSNATMLWHDPSSGRDINISENTYGAVAGVQNKLNTSDVSSLDRRDIQNEITNSLQTNVHSGTQIDFVGGSHLLANEWDSAQDQVAPINSEISDAIAGTKPKYRYRKYLDQITMLQNDQPGQLQTILSKGSNGSTALGGGAL